MMGNRPPDLSVPILNVNFYFFLIILKYLNSFSFFMILKIVRFGAWVGGGGRVMERCVWNLRTNEIGNK